MKNAPPQLPPAHLDLEVARAAAFSQQIPVLYGILIVNSAFTILVQMRHAPFWLAVVVPSVMISLCLVRLLHWWRRRHIRLTRAAARQSMRRLNALAVLLTVVLAGWSAALFNGYGDFLSKAQAAFYMSFTCIGCCACLMQSPRANLRVAGLATIGFGAMLFATGEKVLMLVAINYALVLAAMLFVMHRHSRDFARLVSSTAHILQKTEELQTLSDENLRLANLDMLTGLANRRMFFASLETAIAGGAAAGETRAIGILDLDGFKGVNDAYGHGVGDQLLVAVARRLEETASTDFVVHRLGGDEFALVACTQMSPEILLARGRAICTRIADTCRIGDVTANVTATIGFALYPEAAQDRQALFDRADYALYHAKRTAQRGQPILFAREHETTIRAESIVMQALRTADLETEVHALYQPIVDARTREVVAFEALSRWTSAELGPVSPAVFVPIAERIGQVGRITGIMLPKALAEMARWPEHVALSFNLSVEDVGCPDTISGICRTVRASGVDPRRIDFEITETALVRSWEDTLDSLHMLIALGSRIALDDFGTGYSSLAQLHRLPLDKIKIDRAFVTGIEGNAMSRRIVQSVVTLAADIGIVTVVEGVETEDEYRVIRDLGADRIQGYLFHKPMTADDAAALFPQSTGARSVG